MSTNWDEIRAAIEGRSDEYFKELEKTKCRKRLSRIFAILAAMFALGGLLLCIVTL